ncbi:hypothetical protein WA026_022074 [Henosepilachna vigintioctopunctata]|uniref:Uncharacterized protein n=1 Tax=Henosepilachna vigintioctopunctata TaxID=420089 RepID=A0AAW1U613_9CUCU
MQPKINRIEVFLQIYGPDLLCISEHWLRRDAIEVQEENIGKVFESCRTMMKLDKILCERLEYRNWNIIHGNNIEETFRLFTSTYARVMDEVCPPQSRTIRDRRNKSTSENWITNDIKEEAVKLEEIK